jgi:hypothetical protein
MNDSDTAGYAFPPSPVYVAGEVLKYVFSVTPHHVRMLLRVCGNLDPYER